MNKVYFIGAGPGDPELLTRRGERLLRSCGTVWVPPPLDETFADLLVGKNLLLPFDFYFDDLLERIDRERKVAPVAFLVPGDLTFFSPFQAVVDALGEEASVVPGVGTVNAASAHLKKTLDLPGVCNRTILASPRTLGDGPEAPRLRDLARPGVCLVIYMNNLPLADLVAELKIGFGSSVPIALFHRLGLAEEEVVTGTLNDIATKVDGRDFFNLEGEGESRPPALTLVVAGEAIAARPDGQWWDYRREHIWRFRCPA